MLWDRYWVQIQRQVHKQINLSSITNIDTNTNKACTTWWKTWKPTIEIDTVFNIFNIFLLDSGGIFELDKDKGRYFHSIPIVLLRAKLLLWNTGAAKYYSLFLSNIISENTCSGKKKFNPKILCLSVIVSISKRICLLKFIQSIFNICWFPSRLPNHLRTFFFLKVGKFSARWVSNEFTKMWDSVSRGNALNGHRLLFDKRPKNII